MERRVFILGLGSILIGACTSKPRTQTRAGGNPYVANGAPGTGPIAHPGYPAPPAPPSRVVTARSTRAATPRVATPTGGVHYMTRCGDTLEGIAAQHGITCQSICAANPGRVAAGRVPEGRMIWLPGAEAAACAPATVARARVPAPGETPVRAAPRAARGGYKLVRRRDWGAESLKPNHDPMNGVRRITLHHTDEVPGIRARSDREIVSAIQRYHRNSLGWADIGYHYLIGRDGLVYEGRSAHAQGAHSGGANNVQNLGIAVIGNFSRRMPSASQMSALQAFLEDRKRMHRVRDNKIYGHRDLGPTECPGTSLYGWLTQYRA